MNAQEVMNEAHEHRLALARKHCQYQSDSHKVVFWLSNDGLMWCFKKHKEFQPEMLNEEIDVPQIVFDDKELNATLHKLRVDAEYEVRKKLLEVVNEVVTRNTN